MAASLEAVRMLMQEIGPATPEIDTVMELDETNWAVELADETVVQFEWLEKPMRLALTAMLGHVNAKRQISIYQTLLSYNLLLKETGGVKFALDGPDGQVVLIFELYTADLILADFRTVLINFADFIPLWTAYVTSDIDMEKPALDAANLHLHI